jgi:hypothetical protein
MFFYLELRHCHCSKYAKQHMLNNNVIYKINLIADMESHIMNMPYHQPRYRTIGHKIMRSTSDSLSSESSCNQNSPEYKTQHPGYDRNHYEDESEGHDWEENQNVSIYQFL